MPDDKQTVPLSEFTELKAKYNSLDERSKRMEGLAKDLEVKLDAFKGIDPEKYKATVEELDLLKQDKAKKGSDEDLEKWKKETRAEIETDLRKTLQKSVDDLTEENKRLKANERKYTITDRAWDEVSNTFTNDSKLFIKQFYIEKFVDKDDKGDFVVKDDDGNVRFSPGNPNKKLSLSEFAGEIANKHPANAANTNTSGTKQIGQKLTGEVDGLTVERFMKMTPEQRRELPVETHRKLSREYINQQSVR